LTLLVATTNSNKLREIRPLLHGLRVEMVTLSDLPPVEPPEETGRTFAENARLKATYYAAATGYLTVAEDSGLEVDALGGAPGVESARFGGAGTSYPEKFSLMRDALSAAGVRDSTARFVCALALADPHGLVFEATASVEGVVVTDARGSGGFGYDPIFFYPPFGCTLAEAGDRKSEVSHRTQAFKALRQYLESDR
jgi:XTP/dITP diphosphohydrolase